MKPAPEKLCAGMVAPTTLVPLFSTTATLVPLPLTNCKISNCRTNLRLGKASRYHWYFNESFLHVFFLCLFVCFCSYFSFLWSPKTSSQSLKIFLLHVMHFTFHPILLVQISKLSDLLWKNLHSFSLFPVLFNFFINELHKHSSPLLLSSDPLSLASS